MNSDPIETIKDHISKYATGHIGVVVGIINAAQPHTSNPFLLFAGEDLLSRDQSQSITLDGTTPFNIGSITKIFTSTLQSIQKSPFSGNFGDFFKYGKIPSNVADIELQQLAIYESGFPTDNKGGWWTGHPLQSLEDLISVFNDYTLPQNTPGTCYSYSNFGWGLAWAGLRRMPLPAAPMV